MQQRTLDRRAILLAAATLAEETGIENLTLSGLAESLGVKSPSLYNHIGGLNDLFTGLAELGLTRFGATIRDAAVGKSKEDALIAIARAYRRFASENPELYKCIMKLPALDRDSLQESVDALERILLMVLEPYQMGKPDEIHMSRIWKSAIHGFISLEASGFFKSEYDIEESFDRMIRCILTGMHVVSVK
ncbi:MAG: WHG domain-containing protein [Eubacteriales bacterium]